jgi:hypothetical protein
MSNGDLGAVVIWTPGQDAGVPHIVYTPLSTVELYVFRADLLGLANIGATAGLYHTGLGMREPSTGKEWALDLAALTTLTTAVVPYVNEAGEVEIDARCCMTYYPVETRNQWRSYWKLSYRSNLVCTISPEQYLGLLRFLFGTFTDKLSDYSLFVLEGPTMSKEPEQSSIEISTTSRYTDDMTCDTYVYETFTFLERTHGTSISPFPMLRCHLSCITPPVKVTSRSDPELVAFVQTINTIANTTGNKLIPRLTSDRELQVQILYLFNDLKTKGIHDSDVQADLLRIKKLLFDDDSASEFAPALLHAALQSHSQRADVSIDVISSAASQALATGPFGSAVFVYSLDRESGEANFYKVPANQMSLFAATRYTTVGQRHRGIWIAIGVLVFLAGVLLLWCYQARK